MAPPVSEPAQAGRWCSRREHLRQPRGCRTQRFGAKDQRIGSRTKEFSRNRQRFLRANRMAAGIACQPRNGRDVENSAGRSYQETRDILGKWNDRRSFVRLRGEREGQHMYLPRALALAVALRRMVLRRRRWRRWAVVHRHGNGVNLGLNSARIPLAVAGLHNRKRSMTGKEYAYQADDENPDHRGAGPAGWHTIIARPSDRADPRGPPPAATPAQKWTTSASRGSWRRRVQVACGKPGACRRQNRRAL